MCEAVAKSPQKLKVALSAVAAAVLLTSPGPVSRAQDIRALHATFLNPPADAKPMVRWWWFGPAVTPEEIRKEIDQMRAGGFGGFELASVYPLALDDPAKGIRNLRYASPEMVDMLRVAQEHGRELGMRVDLTLGSGWPFGGPHIPLELAAGKLKLVVVPWPSRSANVQIPVLAPGEHFIAYFTAAGTPEHWDLASAKLAGTAADAHALDYAVNSPHDVVLFFIASHTKQMVKRAAVGGEGYVLDHMSRTAIDTHNRAVSESLLKGFAGDKPPYAVFSDSLEVYGSDWTPTLPEEFKKRRGYDLIPHLPELWQGGTPQAEAVRHDWGVTLSDLVRENYLRPMADFASAHGTKFRSQTYGEPAATLSDVSVPQLPEGEGPQWDNFSFTRWTSSANHIFGNNITSAETWTWLHSPAFRATPLDMKVEADRMFLEGVNQIIGHGWPYSPPSAQEPGYSLYAAAVFNAHNPWWPVMPAVTKYLQRASWLLRQGAPANDVAILLPEDDAQASFVPGHVSVTEGMKQRITPALMQAVLRTGHNVDYIDGPALETHTVAYKAIVVPHTTRMRLATAKALEAYVSAGGNLLFVDGSPSLPPGLMDAGDGAELKSIVANLESRASRVTLQQLALTLRHVAPAPFDLQGANGAVGFIQRSLPTSDLYFVANTSPEPRTFTLHVTSRHSHLAWWGIEDDSTTHASSGERVKLPAYGSRVLVASDQDGNDRDTKERDANASMPPGNGAVERVIALADWRMNFHGGALSPAVMERPASTANTSMDWSIDPASRFYSGEVRYTAHAHLDSGATGERTVLRFASGHALPEDASAKPKLASRPGMRAWYDAPIRDAATVLVNGREAGVLWHPPYSLDISDFLKPGENTIELRVYNTAINALAGQPPRDYTALKAKYGDRFQMQDMDHLQPVSSGIIGPVELVRTPASSRQTRKHPR